MLNFLFPILDRMNDGRFIKQIVVLSLRVIAGVLALAGLVSVIGVFKVAFSAAVPASVSLAGLVVAALIVASAICMIQISLYRGSKIAVLREGEYVFIGIAAHLLRMFAEIFAAGFVTIGLSAFVVAIFAGQAGMGLENMLPGPFSAMAVSGFGGFIALLVAVALAFVCLVAGYLFAEFLELLTRVAGDVHQISSTSPALPAPRLCQDCHRPLESGFAFCTACGAPAIEAAHA